GGVELDAALEDARILHPALRLPIQAIEGAEGADVRRVLLEDRVVGLDRARRVAELLLLELRDREQSGLPVLWIRRQLELLVVDLEQVRPASRLAVQGLERDERLRVVGLAL